MKKSKFKTCSGVLAFAFCIVPCFQPIRSQDGPKPPREQLRTLSREQITALELAIEDEVYDYSQEKAFFDVGTPTDGPAGRSENIPMYIDPRLTSDGMGEAIYKDMPFGEIIRAFHVDASGMIVLAGGPQIGFPVTQPSHLTVFMDDDELCEDKAHWLRGDFTIKDSPSRGFVIQAANRQLKRVGFSQFLSAHRHAKSQ